MSAAVLFLDIRAAYYRVIRQLVSSVSPQEGIARLLLYFDLGTTRPDDLLHELNEEAAAADIGVYQKICKSFWQRRRAVRGSLRFFVRNYTKALRVPVRGTDWRISFSQ